MPLRKPFSLIIFGVALSLLGSFSTSASADENEDAPIIEEDMEFFDFTFKNTAGEELNLRRYASGKRLVIVGYLAGWCKNSKQNAPVLSRLYDKYSSRGLGMVVVSEYAGADEIRALVEASSLQCPVVTESDSRRARRRTSHYRYRRSVGDRRQWGTPFYVIIETADILPEQSKAPLVRRAYVVTGEIVESEAEEFIEEKLSGVTESG